MLTRSSSNQLRHGPHDYRKNWGRPVESLEKPLPEREKRGVTKGYLFAAGPGSKTECRHTFRQAFRRAVEAAKMAPDTITPMF